MTRLIITICFLVAFAAGLTVGIESRQVDPAQKDESARKCRSWFSTELNLTPQQKEQLHAIWSETARQGGYERERRRRELWRERDQAIAELIRPEDRPRYDEVVQTYSEKLMALDWEWRIAFRAAVEQTKEILTPEQRDKYEKMLQRHQLDRRRWYRGGWTPSPSDTQPSATAPAA